MKESHRKSLRALAIAAGIAALLAGAFAAGRMYPLESASAARKDFEVIDKATPSALSSPQAKNLAPLPFQNGSDPFQNLKQMEQEMDELFNRAFANFGGNSGMRFPLGGFGSVPDMDLREEDNAYVIRLDMPGIETGSIKVQVEDNQLTISGTRTEDTAQNAGSVLRKERHVGSFTRSTILPESVDPATLKTEYKDGVLTIRVQKQA